MGSTGPAPESRLQPRFAVWGWGAWIEWCDADGGGGADAELVNISTGGALLLAPTSPGAGQVVTLDIAGLESPAPFPAVVVATRQGTAGYQVHLEFLERCPLAVLEEVLVDRRPAGPWGRPDPPPAPGLAWYESAIRRGLGR